MGRARSKLFSLLVKSSFASFGSRTVLELPVRLQGVDRIAIGSDVYVGAGSWLQTLGEGSLATALTIGDGTSIAGGCVFSAAASVTVGPKVLFARNVYVSDHMHAYADVDLPVLEQGITGIAPVVIAEGAWLGQNVVVCPGVQIGRGAVIGANSVVTKDVPAFALAVGAPARVVKRFGLAEQLEAVS